MSDELNSQDFIRRLKLSDQQAWRTFVQHYQRKIYQTAYSFTQSRDAAEDLVQEIFLTVFNKISTFQHQSHIGTWLYRIAVNTSINYVKKHQRYIHESMDEQNDEIFSELSTIAADEVAEQKELQKYLNKAISSLPPRQMKVFVLHKIHGLSYKEIAEILNLSISSVESLMHRARTNLQMKLHKIYKKTR